MEESDAEIDGGHEMTKGFESESESNTTGSTKEERKWKELEEQQEAQKKGTVSHYSESMYVLLSYIVSYL